MLHKKNWIVLFAVLALGIAYRLLIWAIFPFGTGSDECQHWNYIAYIGNELSLPSHIDSVGEGGSWYENYQPPLYYVLMAILSGGDPMMARVWNIAFWAIGTVFSVGFLFRYYDRTLCFLAGCFLALMPSYAFAGLGVSNFQMSVMFCCIAFYYLRRQAMFFFLLAALTKSSAIVALPILVLLAIFSKHSRKWMLGGAVALVLGLAINMLVEYLRFGELGASVGRIAANYNIPLERTIRYTLETIFVGFGANSQIRCGSDVVAAVALVLFLFAALRSEHKVIYLISFLASFFICVADGQLHGVPTSGRFMWHLAPLLIEWPLWFLCDDETRMSITVVPSRLKWATIILFFLWVGHSTFKSLMMWQALSR